MEAERKCPHCAETIKADATICRFCHLDITTRPKSDSPAPPVCPDCRVTLIPIQKANQVSFAGLVGVVGFFIGLFSMFASILMGAIIMIVALVIGSVGRGTHTVMTCPQCGKRGATL